MGPPKGMFSCREKAFRRCFLPYCESDGRDCHENPGDGSSLGPSLGLTVALALGEVWSGETAQAGVRGGTGEP